MLLFELSVILLFDVIFWLKYSYDSVFIDWLVLVWPKAFLFCESLEDDIKFFDFEV